MDNHSLLHIGSRPNFGAVTSNEGDQLTVTSCIVTLLHLQATYPRIIWVTSVPSRIGMINRPTAIVPGC